MQTDESGAPWPYEAAPAVAPDDDAMPTWECPDGGCACHPPRGEEDPSKHRIVLFDHEAKPMAGARCRVIESGKLINAKSPYADGSGAVEVNLSHETRVLEVEWAPADLPRTARYPFRKRYHVDLGQTRSLAVARRLHNIGFSREMTLRDNILDYQRAYDKPLTGRAEDVEAELVGYHDGAALPPIPQGGGGSADKASADKASPDKASADKASPDGASSLVPRRFVPDQEGNDGGPAAKPGTSDQEGNDGGPAAKPGTSDQGTVTGLSSVKVVIELQMAFSLALDRFQAEDIAWDDAPYDVAALLKELYPTEGDMTWRLSWAHSTPVVGAELTVVGSAVSKPPAPTDARGKATLDLVVPAGGDPILSVKIAPPPGQLNTTGRPAGPALTDETTSAPHLFRPFTLMLGVDETGALVTETCDVVPEQSTLSLRPDPRYVRIISITKGTKNGDNLIVVDWRPDWILSGKNKRKKPRFYDKRDTPINPFDNTHRSDDRLLRAPPVVVIHQTGTHHLQFLPGFIGDGSDESIHYVVDIDGFVIKVLDEHYRANHAGGSAWDQRVDANHFSVGIETMHSDTTPLAPREGENKKVTLRRYTREQYDSFIRLLGELRAAYPLLGRRVVGHMEVLITGMDQKWATLEEEKGTHGRVVDGTLHRDRVGCPGTFFEWQRLEEAGVALAAAPLPATPPSDPAIAGTFAELSKLQGVTLVDKKGPEAKLIKQLLFDMGYSVILEPAIYDDRADLAKIREGITEDIDAPTLEAVRAFQSHHFSGRRRAYAVYTAPKAGETAAGTIDGPTIDAIQQKWYAAMTET